MDGLPRLDPARERVRPLALRRLQPPVHPTQLYESAVGFVLAAIAFGLWSKRQFRGQVILVVAILYGVWRFLIEYVRDDPERGFYFGFSTSQLISLALVPVCGFLYFELRKRHLAAAGDAPAGETPEPEAKEDEDEPKKPTKKRRRKKKKKS